jgi:hypothetical protein
MPTRCTVAATCSCNRNSCASRHAGKPEKPDHTFERAPTTLPKPPRSSKSPKPAHTNATAQRASEIATRRCSRHPARARAGPDPESRACAYSTPRRPAGRLPCVLPSSVLPLPGLIRRKPSRVTWCPCEKECAGPRWTGKPLQIAVDTVPGTTDAPFRRIGFDGLSAAAISPQTNVG